MSDFEPIERGTRTCGQETFIAVSAAYDGPIPPAEYAAARYGRGALERLECAADAASIEAQAATLRTALVQLRLALGRHAGAVGGEQAHRLALALAQCRRAALHCLAPNRA